MPFAENLNYLMEGHMLSKYRLAKDLGCSQTTVAYWLDGTRMPHRKMQEKIAARFGISVEELNGDRFPELKSGGELPDWNRKEEKPAPQAGDGLISADVLDDSLMLQTDNPVSVLMDQYMIPSDVMDVVAGAKPGSSAAWKDGLGVPNKEQYQKIAEFFELDESALERGVLPLRPSEKVWGKLAERTEERFPHSLAALKAVQKYAADSSEENYKELVSCLKGLSPDVQKKIVIEFLTP